MCKAPWEFLFSFGYFRGLQCHSKLLWQADTRVSRQEQPLPARKCSAVPRKRLSRCVCALGMVSSMLEVPALHFSLVLPVILLPAQADRELIKNY